MTAAQVMTLAGLPRPADATDCGVLRDRAGAWVIAWLRDGGRLPEIVTGIDFKSVRAACDASHFLREQHGLDH